MFLGQLSYILIVIMVFVATVEVTEFPYKVLSIGEHTTLQSRIRGNFNEIFLRWRINGNKTRTQIDAGRNTISVIGNEAGVRTYECYYAGSYSSQQHAMTNVIIRGTLCQTLYSCLY